ncbi:MAG: hypothetical protein PQJ50_00910 [Spirochaetales bacterium]|nr:hypothetical protein [Spirochaetales bacterium]
MAISFSLKGKTAIITGANTGLGQGLCLGMAEAGANLVGVSRSDDSGTYALPLSMIIAMALAIVYASMGEK